jgi:hypothetical protein
MFIEVMITIELLDESIASITDTKELCAKHIKIRKIVIDLNVMKENDVLQ